MVGEGDVVEILVIVVGIEGAPGAILALHADDPLAGARNGVAIKRLIRNAVGAIHRHHHHRGVVDIGIVGVGVLEGPAARPQTRAPVDPIALEVQDLKRFEPTQSARHPLVRRIGTDVHKGVAHQPGIPDRRYAGLAVGLVSLDDQKLFDRGAPGDDQWMIARIAERLEHHQRIGHGRKNPADAVLAVEAFDDEGDRFIDGALACALGEKRFGNPQQHVESAEQQKPGPFLMRRLVRRPERLRRLDEQLVDGDALGVACLRLERLQDQHGRDGGARPVRNLGEMERKPARKQHDLNRHQRQCAPGHDAEQRQQESGEHVGTGCAAAGANRFARAPHVVGIRRVADHLEREIAADAGADVEIAVAEQGPAAVRALRAPQVDGDLRLPALCRCPRRESAAA